METKEQPQGNKEMPKDPKPNDEVQLNIETVTPEDSKDTQAPKAKPSENEADQKTDQDDEEAHPAADELSKDAGNPNDARDQIETINP